jgi:hypothetical protein
MAKIPGDKKHIAHITKYKDFSPELDIEVADLRVAGNYVVYSKDIPDPTDHPTKDGKIRWFNAFGVKDRNGNDADVKYTVTLQKLPDDTVLYYGVQKQNQPGAYDVVQIADTDIERLPGDRIRFTLAIGDPPTGVYP